MFEKRCKEDRENIFYLDLDLRCLREELKEITKERDALLKALAACSCDRSS